MVWPAPGFDFAVCRVLFSVWFDTWRSLVVPREQNDGTFASEGTIIGVCITGLRDYTKAGRAGALDTKLAFSEEHVSKARKLESI